ncbi:MAG: STAS domain-containing protein [Pseudomonadota bacterium]
MNTLSLPANCDRAATKAFYTDICEGLGPAPLTIDASAVEKIGQAMFQVLVAASAGDGGVVIAAPSAAFCEAAKLAGLDQRLLAEPA